MPTAFRNICALGFHPVIFLKGNTFAYSMNCFLWNKKKEENLSDVDHNNRLELDLTSRFCGGPSSYTAKYAGGASCILTRGNGYEAATIFQKCTGSWVHKNIWFNCQLITQPICPDLCILYFVRSGRYSVAVAKAEQCSLSAAHDTARCCYTPDSSSSVLLGGEGRGILRVWDPPLLYGP